MSRLLSIAIVSAAALLLTGGGKVWGQYNPYYPYPTIPRAGIGVTPYTQGSTVSPYLNLVPGRTRDYFLGTLPEIDRRANAALFSSAISNIDQRLSMPPQRQDGIGPVLNETGHPVYFGNYGSYFYMPGAARPYQSGAQTAAPPRSR